MFCCLSSDKPQSQTVHILRWHGLNKQVDFKLISNVLGTPVVKSFATHVLLPFICQAVGYVEEMQVCYFKPAFVSFSD